MKSEALKRNKYYIYAIGIMTLLILVILGIGWFFSFKVSAEVAKLKTESLYLNEESDKKTEIVQKYNRVSDYQATVNDAIPPTKEISSFIADVELIALKTGVRINSSNIGTINKKKNPEPDLSQTIKQKDYYELQIKYDVDGSYQAFLAFLNEMNGLRRLNNVSDIKINKITASATTDAVNVNFTDSIFIKK